jgi:cytidylate kinase
MRRRGPIIAIDGPAGAGKTTAARNLARRMGYDYLDTGATFRAVALKVIEQGIDLDDPRTHGEGSEAVADITRQCEIRFGGTSSERVYLDGEDITEAIRREDVSRVASRIAAAPEVRRILMRLWREIGKDGGIVIEGRDIGTVVFPEAEVKFFLIAREEIRAQRRSHELGGGRRIDAQRVALEMARRDEADRSRRHAPLARARDAVEVDTSELSREETADLLERETRARLTGTGGARPGFKTFQIK